MRTSISLQEFQSIFDVYFVEMNNNPVPCWRRSFRGESFVKSVKNVVIYGHYMVAVTGKIICKLTHVDFPRAYRPFMPGTRHFPPERETLVQKQHGEETSFSSVFATKRIYSTFRRLHLNLKSHRALFDLLFANFGPFLHHLQFLSSHRSKAEV